MANGEGEGKGEEDERNMKKKRGYTYPELHDKGWLNEKYWREELSTYKIATILGCSGQAVFDALKEFGIPRRSISESKKGDKHPLFGKESLFKGKTHTNTAKRKMSKKKKGKPSDKKGKTQYKELLDREYLTHSYWDEMSSLRDIAEAIGCSIERVFNAFVVLGIKRRDPNEGCKLDRAREQNSEAKLKNWNDEEYIKKWMDATHAKPNKLEKLVAEMLEELQPNEWRYNGNFEEGVVLAGMIPDFINVNGKKEVIEVFGTVYHDPEKAFMEVGWKRQEFGRKAAYSQLGYKCVVLWEDKIKAEGEKYIEEEIKDQ